MAGYSNMTLRSTGSNTSLSASWVTEWPAAVVWGTTIITANASRDRMRMIHRPPSLLGGRRTSRTPSNGLVEATCRAGNHDAISEDTKPMTMAHRAYRQRNDMGTG